MSRPAKRALPFFLIFGLVLPCQADAAPFRLTSPQAKAPLGDAIRITVASPGAGRVVFRARWVSKGKRRTRTIGSVAQARDARTSSFVWDASSVSGRSDVEIVARILDDEGDYLGTTPWRRMSPARQTVRAASEAVSMQVSGTCDTASCTLNVRADPDASSRRIAVVDEHDIVTVACRIKGAQVRSSTHGSSRIWNRLSAGGWVSDLYLTPVDEQAPAPGWCE